MATIRAGNKAVLLIVDVQVGVIAGARDGPRVVGNVARVVERARASGVPVLWVQHTNEEMAQGSALWQWVPELVPAEGEPRVHKRFHSSFEQTSLDEELARLDASHIVLAGAETNWCIRATAYGALERGYDLTLVKDAHTAGDVDLGDGTSIPAESVVRDLNVAMTWLSYPGRANGTAGTEEVDFFTPGGARPAWSAA